MYRDPRCSACFSGHGYLDSIILPFTNTLADFDGDWHGNMIPDGVDYSLYQNGVSHQ